MIETAYKLFLQVLRGLGKELDKNTTQRKSSYAQIANNLSTTVVLSASLKPPGRRKRTQPSTFK